MKKLLLALMMMLSVSFSDSLPTFPQSSFEGMLPSIYVADNMYFTKASGGYNVSYSSFNWDANVPFPKDTLYFEGNAFRYNYYRGSAFGSVFYELHSYSYVSSSINPCKEPSTIVNGECIKPSEPANCNNFAGQYSSSSGQCEDCSSFGNNFSGRASCACAAMGSSYVPQSVIPVFSESSGGKTYEKRDAKCENGSTVPVYTNAVDIPKDTNGTSPTNPTNPADNNSTKPTDPNSGSGGAGGAGGTGGTGGGTTNPTNPADNNSTKPTNPSDNNNTNPTTPSQSDVVNAVKDATDKTLKAINETNTATKAVDTSVKAVDTSVKSVDKSVQAVDTSVKSVDKSVQSVNTTLQTSNTKLDSMVTKLSDSNSLLKDSKDIQSDTKALLTQEFKETKAFRENLDTRLKNLIDVSLDNGSQLSHINTNVASTTNAVNAQGDKITGKLDDLLNAIKDSNGSGKKDGNGTDMKPTNDLLEKIKGDINATSKGFDKLHDDLNTTNDILGKLKGMFDNNNSFKAPDLNNSDFKLSDLLPSNSWFDTNKLKLDFNNYGGGCYCETAEFSVAGHTFVFPPQEALDVIPFDVISKIFMAFIYVIGLKAFLRN